MNTAIIFTTKHGTTAKVAALIAEKLKDTDTKLFNLKEVKKIDIGNFECIILGTSMYAGNASKKLQTFIHKNQDALLNKKLGLFVCGMEQNLNNQQNELKKSFPQWLHQKAVAEQFCGGEFLFERMNFIERMIIKRIAKTNKSLSNILTENIDLLVTAMK
ncbi:MAG: flavodoxin domain-containing protein [Bacteroidales bacterium]|jgi:menaquinone-dependent protoporphyrinogen oxidase|nr:flavodoxin domain-containing protein [Bacteroidales bacterium]